MKRALALLLALAMPAPALAQGETVAIANGWSLTTRLRGLTDPNAAACTDDRAYVRDWRGALVAWDGQGWSELPPPPGYVEGRAYGTHLAASARGVSIEASGAIASFDGTTWSLATREHAAPYDALGGIATIDAHDFVVGRGFVARREGTVLHSYDAGTWRDLSAVAGTSARDLWIAGQGGTLMHWDGHGWTRAASGTDAWLGGLVAVGERDVWAWSERGSAPLVLHFDGDAWSVVPPPLGDDIRQISVRSGRVWAATNVGVFERADATWRSALTSYDFPDQREIIAACATRTHLVVAIRMGAVATRPL